MAFTLSHEPIVAGPSGSEAVSAESGAVVVFEGRVRAANEGRRVLRLRYSCYEALALKEGARLVEEARARFAVERITAVHRIGELAVGELAVRVQVESAHRGAAFDACRWLIDEMKARVPIWKKELYEGSAQWL